MKQIISNLSGKKRIGECTKCGNCCRVPNWKEDLESDRTLQIMKQFDADTDTILKLLEGHNKCPQLGNDNICAIFKTRPKHCRNYPANEWEKEYHECKGYEFIFTAELLIQELHKLVTNKELSKKDADKIKELIRYI